MHAKHGNIRFRRQFAQAVSQQVRSEGCQNEVVKDPVLRLSNKLFLQHCHKRQHRSPVDGDIL